MQTGSRRWVVLRLVLIVSLITSGCSDDGATSPTAAGDEIVHLSIQGRVGTASEWFPDVPIELGYWDPRNQPFVWRTWAQSRSTPEGEYAIRTSIVRRGHWGWEDISQWTPGCMDLILLATIEELAHRQHLGAEVCDGSGVAVRNFIVRHVEVEATGEVRYTNGDPVRHARVSLDGSVGTTGNDGRYEIRAQVLDGRCDPASDYFDRDEALRVVVTDFTGAAQQGAESEPLACGTNRVDLTVPEPVPASPVNVQGTVAVTGDPIDQVDGTLWVRRRPE